jgi:Na+/melibiose symporter-like transporter
MKATNINLFYYSIIAFPLAFAGVPLYIYAPDFYATHLGISLTSLGFILLILRFIDAFEDPLIGFFSEKFSQNKIFIFGALVLGIGFLMLFNPINTYVKTWFFISIFFASTGFSIISINLNSLGGTWLKNPSQKTKITGFREAASLIGLIIAAITPTILEKTYSKQEAFSNFSFIFTAILAVSLAIFLLFFLKKFTPEITIKSNSFSLVEFFRSIKSKSYFYSIYFISLLASSIPAILIIFFVRDKLNLESYLGIFLISYFLAAAISMPFWNYLSIKKGKIFAWKISMILAVISFISAFTLVEGDFYLYLLICIFSGIAFGGELALPPAILSDLIDKNEKSHAVGDFSILAFLSKLALAIATGLILPLLEYSGFKPNYSNSDYSLSMLGFYYAILPCFIKIFAFMLLKEKKLCSKNYQ